MASEPSFVDLIEQASKLSKNIETLLKDHKLDPKLKEQLEDLSCRSKDLRSGLKAQAADLQFFCQLLIKTGLARFVQAGGDAQKLLMKIGFQL